MFAKFSVKKPLTVLVLVIVVLVFGLVSFTRMTPGLFPNIDLPYVAVTTVYGGATPEQVEETVTVPLEEQLASLENVTGTQSVSSRGFSMVFLEFEDGTDLSAISADIRDRIDIISDGWNDSVGRPAIMKINPEMMPVTVAAVSHEEMGIEELTDMLEEDLELELRGIDGVAAINVSGAVDNMISVKISEDKTEKANRKLKNAINSSLGGMDTSSLDRAQNQISAGKKELRKARGALISSTETVSLALENISDAVKDRDMAAASGNTAGAMLLQAQIDEIKKSLKDFSKDLQLIGIDMDRIDENSLSATTALNTFNIYKANSFSALSDRLSELSAKEAEVASAKNQLSMSLAQMGSAGGSVDVSNMLTVENVSAIISAQNFRMPAGYISDDGTEMMVSVGDTVKSIGELRNLVILDVGISGVSPVKLSDVADVSYLSNGEETYGKINGKEGILVTFTQQSNYSTTEVADNIQKAFTGLEKDYKGLKFDTLSDQGQYIHIVIDSVMSNLLVGALLAILILLLFLRNWRPTFITFVSMPVSITGALLLMYFSGVTLNVISLSGLAAGIGMVVDNSIIVVENIYRLRELGYSRIQAAVSGARQMTGAITASTLTTVCVFAPIVFVEGITRELFADMALTVTYSLGASLLVAMTFVPAMASIMVKKPGKTTAVLSKDSPVLIKFKKSLQHVLNHKKRYFAAAVLLLVLPGALLLWKGMIFMPSMSTQQLSGTVSLADDVTPQQTAGFGDALSDKIENMKEVDTVGIMLSTDLTGAVLNMGTGDTDWSELSVYVLLKEDYTGRSAAVSDSISKEALELGAEDATMSGDMDMSSMSALSGGISIELYGDDIDVLRESALETERILKNTEGVEEVSDLTEDVVAEVDVKVDKNKAMTAGFTTAEVYQQVAAALSRQQYSTGIVLDDVERDVVISSDERENMTEKDLKNLRITKTDSSGETITVPLGDIAKISRGRAMESISHMDQNRVITVTAQVDDEYNVTKVTDSVREKIDENGGFKGVDVKFGGEEETIDEAMEQLVQMMLLALLLIYLIMVAQFQSFRGPFIIMFTVPLAFTGGVLALLISGQEMSVVAMIGFIMLTGIIVNNGIVLVDQINRNRYEGMDMREAVVDACTIRIRPVLMTALTTVLGLVPMAIGVGTGSEMMQPVAIACIGGLLYATLTTLFIVPALYEKMGKKEIRIHDEKEFELIDE